MSRIQNREQQVFVLAGIMTFTDKVIDEDTANEIRGGDWNDKNRNDD